MSMRPQKCKHTVAWLNRRTETVNLLDAIATARRVSKRNPSEPVQIIKSCDEIRSTFLGGESVESQKLRLYRSLAPTEMIELSPELEGFKKRRRKRKRRA